jgi:hypothetical protein
MDLLESRRLLSAAADATEVFSAQAIPSLGVGLGGNAFYAPQRFANALWGDPRGFRDTATSSQIASTNPSQLNANGYPLFLNAGQTLTIWPGQNLLTEARTLLRGRVVLTWQGDADIRLQGATFNASASGGVASTGSLVNGRRVYDVTSSSPNGYEVRVNAVNAANPITRMRLWMPDPSSPLTRSLEPAAGDPEPMFHPTFLSLLEPFGTLRMMDWGKTNNNDQSLWSHRRSVDHATMGDAKSRGGVAWEVMIALANQTQKNLWINIPHQADANYVTQLATLVRDTLDPNLKVYVEYSNEIWSNSLFEQGVWAGQQASALGITKAAFNAKKTAEHWKSFQTVLGAGWEDRLVRVGAIWSAQTDSSVNSTKYTNTWLREMFNNYGPANGTRPDILSPTTYFGNNIQTWAAQNVNYNSPTEADYRRTFDEWQERLLGSNPGTGGSLGPDEVHRPGGIGQELRAMSLHYNLPLVSYEGGPSIYTDEIEPTYGTGITDFMMNINRAPRFADMYRIHLNNAARLGLRSHDAFVETSKYSKFGQWGHVEYLDQGRTFPALMPNANLPQMAFAPKYAFLAEWEEAWQNLNHIDDFVGTRPAFATPDQQILVAQGVVFSRDFDITGGEGTFDITQEGGSLPDGLSWSRVDNDTIRVSGAATTNGEIRIMFRAVDADGDPNWGVYLFKVSEPATPTLSVVASIPGAAEPSSDGAFVLSSSTAVASPITVNILITGTASNGADYVTIPTTLTLDTAGTLNIPVDVLDDNIQEAVETVTITLVAGPGYTLGTTPSATVSISDDDTPMPDGTFLETGGVVSMESEHANLASNTTWEIKPDANASGGEYLVEDQLQQFGTTPTSTEPERMASYNFFINTPGTYELFTRMAVFDNGNSFFYRIDGGAWVSHNDRHSTQAYSWATAGASVSHVLGAGLHSLEVTYREDFTRLDKFVLQLSTAADPTGFGPAESNRHAGDTTPPTVSESVFEFETQHAVSFRFSESVIGSLDVSDVEIRRVSDNALISPVLVSYDASTNRATFRLNPRLADGQYVATLRAGSVADATGNALAQDVTQPFHVLSGDLDRDGSVGFSDLLVLAQNYGQTGRTFSQGNIDYDATGTVGFSDLLLLAQNYGQSQLASASPAKPSTPAPRGGETSVLGKQSKRPAREML